MPRASAFDYESKVWGDQDLSLDPTTLGALRLRYCLEDLADVRGTLVELGCGGGAFLRAAERHRPDLRVVGIDISERAMARAAGSRAGLVRGDVGRLPLASASADAVVFFDVLEHVADADAVLAEAARVLRPGGRLHAFVPCEGSAYTLHGVASRLGFSPKERYAGHIQRLSARELDQRLRSVGLVPRAWRWSGHLFMQVVDLAYFSLLALRGRNVDTTLEALASRSRGLPGVALGLAVRAVAGVGYIESRIMRKAPALGAHVTCVRA
jgi:SAM-dependent methyltransferase